jgi:hypothetical protein
MTEEADPILCPNCFQSMRLLSTMRRAFTEDIDMFRCRPCGLSTTRLAKQPAQPT